MLINIPIEVPESVVSMGGIELYASMYAGWTPTVLTTDGNGIVDEEKNPLLAMDASIAFKQRQLKDEFREVIVRMGREQGEKQAIEQFNSLFPNT